ncbi:retrovirus-related pol polyprotein from transposon TNT 1-94, partial [Tanacetum coccineum]
MNKAFNAGNGNDDNNHIVQRVPRTESTPGKANVQCYNCNEKGYYARDFDGNVETVPSYDAKAVSE